MKNLLYIGNHLSKRGKTETTIETLSKSLQLEGYHVFVSSRIENKLLRLLDMLFSIVKQSQKVHYVLIDTYSTSNFYYAFLCSQLCRVFGLKYIPILHGGNLSKRLETNPILSKAIFKNAFINIAPSGYIQSEFKKHSYTNVVCIPNTIKIKNYTFKQKEYKDVNLLWVRSFSNIYNPFLAVKILKSLLEENIKATLCMVGPDNDGSLQAVKKYAEEIGVEVKFTGLLSKQQWIELSKDYNIFINTTNFDNMPVSVIEAMALGIPVISTNVGGMPFLIENEEDGILVNPNHSGEFVNAVKKLISDSEKIHKITLNARNRVENFDWEVVKKQWFSVLQ